MSEVLIGWAIWIKPAQCSELKASKQSYISQVYACTINTDYKLWPLQLL